MINTALTDDQLTRMHTAFESFEELVNGTARDYRPTLIGNGTVRMLADRYDLAMEAAGDPRRAWRGMAAAVVRRCCS